MATLEIDQSGKWESSDDTVIGVAGVNQYTRSRWTGDTFASYYAQFVPEPFNGNIDDVALSFEPFTPEMAMKYHETNDGNDATLGFRAYTWTPVYVMPEDEWPQSGWRTGSPGGQGSPTTGHVTSESNIIIRILDRIINLLLQVVPE